MITFVLIIYDLLLIIDNNNIYNLFKRLSNNMTIELRRFRIIEAKFSKELEEMLKDCSLKKFQNNQRMIREEESKSLKELISYFRDLGLKKDTDYFYRPNLCEMTAYLTDGQVGYLLINGYANNVCNHF